MVVVSPGTAPKISPITSPGTMTSHGDQDPNSMRSASAIAGKSIIAFSEQKHGHGYREHDLEAVAQRKREQRGKSAQEERPPLAKHEHPGSKKKESGQVEAGERHAENVSAEQRGDEDTAQLA